MARGADFRPFLERGSHAELMALNGNYAELFTQQAAAYRAASERTSA